MSTCQNGVPPMFLSWGNITVTTDQESINRGIAVAIGTPPQIFSLRPSTGDDGLYVVNKAVCAPSYNDTCEGPWGGVYDFHASSTYRQTTQAQWNGTIDPDGLTSIYFNDVLSFGANGTDYGFPMFMDQLGYGGQGVLPLGWNSDFLKVAVSSGVAPSRAFGLWTGSRSIDYPADGSLVLGGYDNTRFGDESSLSTFPSSVGCETCVEITGLSYDTVNGSTNLFANASETLQVSLQPGVRVLNVPQDMFLRFANASNATYDYSLGNLIYPASSPPTGSLSVTLKNGYKTVIPSEELFVYPRNYSNNGVYEIANNTIMLSEIQNSTAESSNILLDWGIPYLTMNYLIADYARNRFQLAPAIRTDFSVQGGGYQLEAICDPGEAVTSTTSSVTSHSPTPTQSVTTSQSSSPGPSKSSDTGAIVGGVVGGVLGLILIVGGLAFLFYRTRRRNARRTSQPRMQEEMSQPGSRPGDRASQYTGTTPHDINDVSSQGKDAHSVNQWLSSNELESEGPTSPRLEHPHEMPAYHFDTE